MTALIVPILHLQLGINAHTQRYGTIMSTILHTHEILDSHLRKRMVHMFLNKELKNGPLTF